MGDLTEHFSRSEFACKCGCGLDAVSIELVQGLEVVRQVLDIPLSISSGCRCPDHNISVGGKVNSEHLEKWGCTGADIRCEDSEIRWNLLYALMSHGFGRIGLAKTFIHAGINKKLPNPVVFFY